MDKADSYIDWRTILKQLDGLPEAAQRIETAMMDAELAPLGSKLELEAVSIWSKHVHALPETVQRIAAAEAAIRYAYPKSSFSSLYPEYDYRFDPPKPTGHQPSGDALIREAASRILKDVDGLPEAA